MNRFVPWGNPCKQAVLGLAVLVVAGCGGTGASAQTRLIRGTGYTFSAPADWAVVRSGRELRVSNGFTLVSVARFPLLRAFRPQLWDQVVPELDRAAEAVARQQHGTVSDRQTVTISGRRARRYDIDYERKGQSAVERIGFLLRGKAEYLLLCRYEAGGDTGACERLLSSFRLAAA